MTLGNFVFRFTVAYLLALVLGSALIQFLHFKNAGAIEIAALLAAALHVCLRFGQRNGRYFSRREKWQAWLSMVAVDCCVQLAYVLALIVPTPAAAPRSGYVAVAAGVAMTLALHGAVSALVIWLVRRILAKQGIGGA